MKKADGGIERLRREVAEKVAKKQGIRKFSPKGKFFIGKHRKIKLPEIA